MKATQLWMGLVLAGLTAAPAGAQDYNQPEPPPRRGGPPPAGFWPTDRLIELAINRITDHMAEAYGFDEDQLWNTRDTIKGRFPQWMQQNRAELQSLMNQYFEAVLGDDPPAPQEVADWAARATPLFEEFTGLVDDTTEEMRGYLTDQQQVLLDGQRAAFQVGMNYMQQRLATWREGRYDWKTEWPRSDTFREKERQRQQQLERETQQARNVAMGLPADTDLGPGDGPPGAKATTTAPTRPSLGATKDEWTAYVENFIKRYNLDEAQQNSARKFLRDQQELRDRYLQRHLSDIQALENKQKTAQGDDAKQQVKADYERLNRPIDGYYQRLKDRLETLPTRKQRAAAAQADEASQAKAPVSEERKAAMKTEMETHASTDKSEKPTEKE